MKRPARRGPSGLRNERGIITLDFIFAFVLVFGMTLILFGFCLSLSVIEITQYITFSAARNYYAGHVSRQMQTDAAIKKFQQLTVQTQPFATLYGRGWYQLGPLEVGPQAEQQTISEYTHGTDRPDRNTFVGARVTLNAKVLEMRIPFFGDTYDQEDGFVARVATFLGRAPTEQEARAVNAQRFAAIRQLESRYQQAPDGAYTIICDNGC